MVREMSSIHSRALGLALLLRVGIDSVFIYFLFCPPDAGYCMRKWLILLMTLERNKHMF